MTSSYGIPTSGSSAIELSYDVTVAAEHLKELSKFEVLLQGDQMKDASHDFNLKNVDETIAHLKELDAKRLKAHELLEAETIKTSILRHQISVHFQKLQSEIDAKVKSTRDSNSGQIKDLQHRVHQLKEKAELSKRTRELLTFQNELLEGDCKKLAEEYEELVGKLNSLMSEKSEMQMELNDTNQALRDTENEIACIKKEMSELDEEMKRLMKRFMEDMHSLNRSLEDVRVQTKNKQEEKKKSEKQFETVLSDIFDNQIILDDKQIALRNTENEVKRLLATEKNLNKKISHGTEEIEKLKEKCITMESEMAETRQDFSVKKEETLNTTDLLEKESEVILEEHRKLLKICKGLKKDYKQVKEHAESQAKTLEKVQQETVAAKAALVFQAEEGARLALEYQKLVGELQLLQECHKENVDDLNVELSDLKDVLSQEKRAKGIVKAKLDELAEVMDTENANHLKIMSELEVKTAGLRKRLLEMSSRMTVLQRATKEEEGAISKLEKQLKFTTLKFRQTKETLTSEVKCLEENIADLQDELSDRKEILSRLKPQCESLKQEFERATEEYEVKKKDLIALKSKKVEVEERIEQIQKEVEKAIKPQEKLKMDTLRCRAYTRQQLRERVKEVEGMEKQVVEATQKILVIDGENKRIIEARDKLSQEAERLKILLKSSKDMEAQLDAALKFYREKLVEQWKKNEDLEKVSSERDKAVLSGLTALREASDKRVSSIHKKYEGELGEFSDFLIVTATGKP